MYPTPDLHKYIYFDLVLLLSRFGSGRDSLPEGVNCHAVV